MTVYGQNTRMLLNKKYKNIIVLIVFY